MEQEENLCDEVERVMDFIYLGDRVSAGGGCEAAVTGRTRYGWVKFRECGELLYGRFPLMRKGSVYESYVRPAILYGSEAWCLRESEIGILRRTERSTVRAICGVQLKDRKKIYRLDVHAGFECHNRSVVYGKQCSLVWSCVEERGWSHLEKVNRFWGLWSRKKGRLKMTWKKQLEEESVKIGLTREDAI